MKAKQTHKPKYWVHHRYDDDDVIILTASKSLTRSKCIMDRLMGPEWREQGIYKASLIEIREVDEL